MNQFQDFWSENEKGLLSLNNYRFKNFLETEDFFKNKPNPRSTFNLIKKQGIFLQIWDDWEIKDYVTNYIEDNSLPEKVFNLMTGRASIFKRDYLSMIKTKEINILKDTKNTAYLFYKNGILEITESKTKLKPYQSEGMHIWEDQVIKREYVPADHHASEYRQFIWKISGGFELTDGMTIDDSNRYSQAVERYNTFQTVIGYFLHSFNSGGNNKAIILNDELISDDPNGRSGKGLFWNAIKQLKKLQSLNGKSFDFNAPFPYQGVRTDCQVLVWDDVKKNFDFEQLFSVITEGIEITYKGKDTIKLTIEDSPKILITTNYTIKGKGGSHEARRFEVELSNYFNEKYTPIDEFGHKLFDDWDDKEWARFDSYMIECLKKYLKFGLLGYKAISLPIKKMQVEITKELYDCINSCAKNEWMSADEFYSSYTATVRKFSERTKTFVTQSIKKYCDFYGLKYDSVTSNGIKKFMICQEGLDKKIEPDMPF